MRVYLIESIDKTFLENEILKFKNTLKIKNYAYLEINPSPSIGISDIRNLKSNLKFKNYAESPRLIVINNAHLSTPEAQNALLKILEEPPPSTYIVLTSGNIHNLLPTIISRCQIIKQQINSDITSFNLNPTIDQIKQIFSSSEGERIIFSQKFFNKKEESLFFLDNLLLVFKKHLTVNYQNLNLSYLQTATLISKVMKAKNYLERNINNKATMDIFLLGLPYLK